MVVLAKYEGGNANMGGGVDVECQNFDSVVHWREDLSPQNLKCPPSHSMSVANLCTNTSCDRELREKMLFHLCTTTLMLRGTLCSQKSRIYLEKRQHI